MSHKRERDYTPVSGTRKLPQDAKALFDDLPLTQANMRLLQDFFGLSAKTRSMSSSSTSESINVHAIKRAYRRLSLTLDIADKQRPPELSAHLEGRDEASESHTE